jgi:hypothetical protein
VRAHADALFIALLAEEYTRDMTHGPIEEPQPDAEDVPVHTSRLQLVWDVALFQFKLLFDGLRDLLLSPLSLVAAVAGLIAGGDDPQRYFRRLLQIGRRTEIWLNLFGHHRSKHTSDDLVAGLRERVFEEAKSNPWVERAGTRLNRGLDSINQTVRKPPTP